MRDHRSSEHRPGRTARRSAERLNWVLAAINSVHRALLRAATEESLYASVCEALTADTPFSLATIAVPENEPAQQIRIIAAAGTAVGYVKDLTIRWDQSPLGDGPAGRAARSQTVQFNDDLMTDPRFVPWRQRASQFGLRSSFVLPVHLPNGTFAALLSVYSERIAAVNRHQLARFQVLGEDLGVCIEVLRTRRALQSALNRAHRQDHQLEVLGRAFENSTSGVLMTGPDNLIVRANRAFEVLFGYSRHEAIGRDPSFLTSGRHDRAFFRAMWRDLRSAGCWSGDIINLTRSRQEIVCCLNIAVARDPHDNVIAHIASFQDVTEQRRASETLAREMHFSQMIMESMPGIVFFFDRDGRIHRWNRNLETVSGYSAAEMRKIHPLDLFAASDRPLARTQFEHAFSKGDADFEAQITAKSIGLRPYLISGRRLNDSGHHFLIGVGIDIDAQKKAEHSLAEHVDVLQRISRQIFEVQELERSAISRELHDSVAQDIGAVSLNIAILRNLLPKSTNVMLLQRLDDSQELLEAATQRLRNVMVDLRPPGFDEFGLVPALRAHAERVARRAGFDVQVSGENPMPPISASEAMALFRIAQEALTNVVKHADASSVQITLTSDAELISMEIRDNGVGFEPKSPQQKFAHIGLMTMAERAELIGAQCSVRARPGEGTAVLIRLERHRARRRAH